MKSILLTLTLLLCPLVKAQTPPVQIDGVFPNLTVYADGVGSTSETGIGALIP